MPAYRPVPFELDVSRNAVILDTNVLVAAFEPRDERHENTKVLLFEVLTDEYNQIIVPISVVVEAWGMLVGSYKDWNAGHELLSWLTNPLNAVLIPQSVNNSNSVREITRAMHIDCVDALLLHLADEVNEQCALKPFIHIATYDTSDYLRSLEVHDFRISVLDARTLEVFP